MFQGTWTYWCQESCQDSCCVPHQAGAAGIRTRSSPTSLHHPPSMKGRRGCWIHTEFNSSLPFPHSVMHLFPAWTLLASAFSELSFSPYVLWFMIFKNGSWLSKMLGKSCCQGDSSGLDAGGPRSGGHKWAGGQDYSNDTLTCASRQNHH